MPELGDLAQDKITGFEGIVTGKCLYISGCDQILLAPKVKDDGSMPEGRWIDIERCFTVQEKAVDPDDVSNTARPGFDTPAPKR